MLCKPNRILDLEILNRLVIEYLIFMNRRQAERQKTGEMVTKDEEMEDKVLMRDRK